MFVGQTRIKFIVLKTFLTAFGHLFPINMTSGFSYKGVFIRINMVPWAMPYLIIDLLLSWSIVMRDYLIIYYELFYEKTALCPMQMSGIQLNSLFSSTLGQKKVIRFLGTIFKNSFLFLFSGRVHSWTFGFICLTKWCWFYRKYINASLKSQTN